MKFSEKEYEGFIIRLCTTPSVRHWKVMKDGAAITTARTLTSAEAKARALKQGELK